MLIVRGRPSKVQYFQHLKHTICETEQNKPLFDFEN
jgi:hypothetical protein